MRLSVFVSEQGADEAKCGCCYVFIYVNICVNLMLKEIKKKIFLYC